MKTLAIYWGYLVGEERLTEDQFIQIDFGNPAIDIEFVVFDPLASSYFKGTYFRMHEKRLFFPHRTPPSMRAETMILYEDTAIKIIVPPAEVEAPIGVLLALFWGKPAHIKLAIDFLEKRINLKFHSCDLNLERLYVKLSETGLEVSPLSFTVENLGIDERLFGDLEVMVEDKDLFLERIKQYMLKIIQIKFTVKEAGFQLDVTAQVNGKITFSRDILMPKLLEIFYDLASRCV